jgi:DNA-binding transcriptional LysR family regulator
VTNGAFLLPPPGSLTSRVFQNNPLGLEFIADTVRFSPVPVFARLGTPERPEDLLHHECITFRSKTTGALYAWELERGKRSWRVPVQGPVTTNDTELMRQLAEAGVGLLYTFELGIAEELRQGSLRIVLGQYAAAVPGFFLYFPSRAQVSPALASTRRVITSCTS